MLTPNELEILLHYYVCPAKHPRLEAMAVQETIRNFLCNDILQHTSSEGVYTTTPKGAAWLTEMLSVPVPTQAWVNSAGKVIPSNS